MGVCIDWGRTDGIKKHIFIHRVDWLLVASMLSRSAVSLNLCARKHATKQISPLLLIMSDKDIAYPSRIKINA
jgi:hypothetical protein